jgi:small subunit ribosomal protein S5
MKKKTDSKEETPAAEPRPVPKARAAPAVPASPLSTVSAAPAPATPDAAAQTAESAAPIVVPAIPDAPEIVVVPVPEEEEAVKPIVSSFNKEAWKPKTSLGQRVKSGELTDIDQILENGVHFMEAEIVDALLPGLESDLLMIGQAKGKFGGGKRRIFKQTQKKTPEGNKPKFSTYCVIGNRDGYVGLGHGKAKETVPAKEKALRNAKLGLIKVRRGCGSWACGCKTPHSIPFAVEGKVGSAYIKLMPAPKGAGLVAESEVQKILQFAGIKDVYSMTDGQTRTRMNLLKATMEALRELMNTRVQEGHFAKLGIADGKKKAEGESQ